MFQAGVDNYGENFYESNYLYTEGYDVWTTYETGVFHLDSITYVEFLLMIDINAGFTGHLDNLRLYGTGSLATPLQEIELPNGDFEYGDGRRWNLDIYNDSNVILNSDSYVNDSYVLSLWKSNSTPYLLEMYYQVSLSSGYYKFTWDFEGKDCNSCLQVIVHEVNGSCHYEGDQIYTTGADRWTTYEKIYPKSKISEQQVCKARFE